jgi:hypothetical protein
MSDEIAVPDPGPQPLAAGTFAIWSDGDEGFVLVVDTPSGGTTRRHISKRLVRMGSRLAGGLFSSAGKD